VKLTPAQREQIRMMFGGRCAYCGVELPARGWHVDHAEPIKRQGSYEQIRAKNSIGPYAFKWRPNGKMDNRGADCKGNLVPACVKCNVLKSSANIEGFRNMLNYFANSIPQIANYSHVNHLMRFGKLTIDPTPVVFWFEQYAQQDGAEEEKR
jgi:hypothetical protein